MTGYYLFTGERLAPEVMDYSSDSEATVDADSTIDFNDIIPEFSDHEEQKEQKPIKKSNRHTQRKRYACSKSILASMKQKLLKANSDDHKAEKKLVAFAIDSDTCSVSKTSETRVNSKHEKKNIYLSRSCRTVCVVYLLVNRTVFY